jgi:hypothetical protein
MLAVLLLMLCASPAPADLPPPGADAAAAPHPREATRLKRRFGVEVMGVRATAAGYMLEFRYRVTDPALARPLFDRRVRPVLVDEETGARMAVPTPPKTGALRNSRPPLAKHIYWMLFANPGGFIKPGRRVAVQIGEFRADGIVVQ